MGLVLGFAASVASALLGGFAGAVFGWPDREPTTLVLLVLAAIGVGAVTTLPGALAAAALSWGTYSGFVTHQFGELRLDAQDRPVLVALVLLGVAASLSGLGIRAWQARTAPATAELAAADAVTPAGMARVREALPRPQAPTPVGVALVSAVTELSKRR